MAVWVVAVWVTASLGSGSLGCVVAPSIVQMRRGDVIDLESGSDLGDLDEDLLNIRKKGISNLKTFFMQYIAG